MIDELTTGRTPVVIASEINTMKRQMEKILLVHAIEIGRRLKEVRAMIPYGEWGDWLKVSVNYSQRTAQRLMALFDAYGEYLSLPPAGESSQNRTLPNLTFVQALTLLELPEEERAEFLMEMDVEGMSTRQLKQAVEQRQEARREADQAVTERDQARQESTALRDDLDKEKNKNARLAAERDSLKAEIHGLERVKGELEQEIENKKASYDKLKERSGYKAIKKMEASLDEAYGKAEANKIAFLYDSFFKTFKELAYGMTKFAGKNPELHAIYKEKIQDFLHNALREKL
ncbi:conserved hypothetical protein [Desulfitobacterium hafniense DCB-2]|uniref:Protein export cytoplasm protein SecA ATPase RNA helicase n=1 Tax=Desulfitobacterium hafniense (strain DSM 10664 / DCB-2) TaxID=272564 RepID=B8FVU4_DESHD|nr:DUF3102 domain-containing protein [Desulfitobacterium hafniense]ACL18730.1 conserved hypothetical protein [Desulfitobacterium hafniense DCB-2]